MQEQRTLSTAEREGQVDSAILVVLLIGLDSHRPWSVEEVAREMWHTGAIRGIPALRPSITECV
jgi:hypothetical protein